VISIATDDAVHMLESGWTVRYCPATDSIEWRSPDGISGSGFHSQSLDSPPIAALAMARQAGQLRDRPRVATERP